WLLRPAKKFFGALHLLGAERRPVSLGGILLAGTAIGDVGVYDDQRGAPTLGLRRLDGGLKRRHIIAVHDLLDMPTVSLESLAHLLGERQFGGAVDGDAIIIIEIDEFSQLQMSGQRGRF